MAEPKLERLILIGYRATGKTTVGRILARHLGWAFTDVDDDIESIFGGSIADIFAQEGEVGFRKREASALKALSAANRCVIATGGGAILQADNRLLLRSLGPVVWLTAGPETILMRLQQDPATAVRRPNLTSTGGMEEVRELLKVREPLYREVAELVVSADNISPEAVATAILTKWTGQPTSPSSSGLRASSSSG
jgi:shikimate kinase